MTWEVSREVRKWGRPGDHRSRGCSGNIAQVSLQGANAPPFTGLPARLRFKGKESLMKKAATMAFQTGVEQFTRHLLSADWLNACPLGDRTFDTDIRAAIPRWALRPRPGRM